MKLSQIIFFLICISLSFTMLNTFGLSTFGGVDYTRFENTFVLMLGIFTAALGTGIILSRFGINPYTTAAYTVMTGLFFGLYGNFILMVDTFASVAGPAGVVIRVVEGAISFAVGILLIYTLVQMATGGAKSFE